MIHWTFLSLKYQVYFISLPPSTNWAWVGSLLTQTRSVSYKDPAQYDPLWIWLYPTVSDSDLTIFVLNLLKTLFFEPNGSNLLLKVLDYVTFLMGKQKKGKEKKKKKSFLIDQITKWVRMETLLMTSLIRPHIKFAFSFFSFYRLTLESLFSYLRVKRSGFWKYLGKDSWSIILFW